MAPSAFALACLGYGFVALGLLTKSEYVVLFSVCVAGLVIGNLLMVFLPKEEHKSGITPSHKLMVVGFALFVIYGGASAFQLAFPFKEFLYYGSITLFVVGMFGIAKAR